MSFLDKIKWMVVIDDHPFFVLIRNQLLTNVER